MEYQFIETSHSGPASIVTVNRPKSLNALNAGVIKELTHFFTQDRGYYGDSSAIIITGSGPKAFVAGADISEIRSLTPAQGVEFAQKGHVLMNSIEQFHLPVIAAVNGFALGGGCELALACHIRIASDHARLGLPEVNLGLIPGYGGTQRLPRAVGEGNALNMILTADLVDAEQALRIGLVTKVCKQEELMNEALKVAAKISSKGPLAIGSAMAAVNASRSESGFEREVELFGKLISTEDAREGTGAFLEKRKADFKGN